MQPLKYTNSDVKPIVPGGTLLRTLANYKIKNKRPHATYLLHKLANLLFIHFYRVLLSGACYEKYGILNEFVPLAIV